VLIPCYQEEEIIIDSLEKLTAYLNQLILENKIASSSFIGVVDDGSTDQTWQQILRFKENNPIFSIKAIRLSHNQGHQTALLAGMFQFLKHYDCVITLDADLQDDIRAIEEMIHLYSKEHKEIVYGVRQKRDTDSFFKKYSAQLYYKILLTLGVNIIENHADFRLTSARVVQNLQGYQESNLFLRGIYPMLGYPTATVYYNRNPRKAGNTKYPISKMIAFALEGITSFSIKPLRLVTWLGFGIFLVSLALSGYALWSYIVQKVVPGWTSIVLPMYLLGGIQLLGIGILGEYIGKIYQEVKRRPRYFIENEIE